MKIPHANPHTTSQGSSIKDYILCGSVYSGQSSTHKMGHYGCNTCPQSPAIPFQVLLPVKEGCPL